MIDDQTKAVLDKIERWRKDVFLFAYEAMGFWKPAQPKDELIDREFEIKDRFGNKKKVKLFDKDGNLVYHDLSFYQKDMFKYQEPSDFRRWAQKKFTWQQTVGLEAYNRAINTFGQDAYDIKKRWVTIRSGHGVGKTATASVITLHFLINFFFSQIGATANTEYQLKDVFMKEVYKWYKRLIPELQSQIEILDNKVRIRDTKDWFMRARVAGKDNPEALAGIHADYVLLFIDEASGVGQAMVESMEGALTGENWVVIMVGNPTRNEGFFYESHKKGAPFTKLHFTSLDSPIVKEGFIESIKEKYGEDSDVYRIRVLGEFAGEQDMDEKGWIPLFANINIHFEEPNDQILNNVIIGVDPAGQGKDFSQIMVRDNIYLKEALREKTSTEIDLARKIEAIRDAYRTTNANIGIDAFGIGAKVVANVRTKTGEGVNAILADKPREETKEEFASFKAEMAWRLREWLARGGIIITNNKQAWLREFSYIKFKRDLRGRIKLMDKVEFKKEYGFSPDRFDGALYTFFRTEPAHKPVLTSDELEQLELEKWKGYNRESNEFDLKKLSSI